MVQCDGSLIEVYGVDLSHGISLDAPPAIFVRDDYVLKNVRGNRHWRIWFQEERTCEHDYAPPVVVVMFDAQVEAEVKVGL